MYILAVKFELCDFGISAYELSALIFYCANWHCI